MDLPDHVSRDLNLHEFILKTVRTETKAGGGGRGRELSPSVGNVFQTQGQKSETERRDYTCLAKIITSKLFGRCGKLGRIYSKMLARVFKRQQGGHEQASQSCGKIVRSTHVTRDFPKNIHLWMSAYVHTYTQLQMHICVCLHDAYLCNMWIYLLPHTNTQTMTQSYNKKNITKRISALA